MSARDEILSNIRRSLRVNGAEGPRRAAVEARLSGSPRGVVPARGQLDAKERIGLFKKMAESAFASVAIVQRPGEVPAEAARWLRDNNLPAALRMGEDKRLADMPWGDTALELAQGASDGRDLNAVSHAFAGVAESGTLIMTSGPDNPSTLNFLPDNHIVVLSGADLAGDYESVFERLREAYGKGVMPRTVNMITGPSRSADIAQTMLLGAHGPRKLHIVIVDAA
ncbi:MAG: lactate utilization protein [Methylobacteriaceae bacterium]|nr:lactate utilization protein [Methylobacteriaceae bacterium]